MEITYERLGSKNSVDYIAVHIGEHRYMLSHTHGYKGWDVRYQGDASSARMARCHGDVIARDLPLLDAKRLVAERHGLAAQPTRRAPGGGRKPKHEAPENITARVSGDVAAWLRSQRGGMGEAIERLVRERMEEKK